MSRSVAAIQRGLDYQARLFWLEAGSRLLNPASPVSRVGYDVDDVDGFDDIVVERSLADRDEFGRSISRDCFQAKWHVDVSSALTADALCDPRTIGGKSRSALQRVQSCLGKLPDGGKNTRLHLVSTHDIDSTDTIARIFSGEGALRPHVFCKGGAGSKMGKLRAKWREHLGLATDEQLVDLLKPLRIWRSAPNYARLKIELESRLPPAGLSVESGDGAEDKYEQLIQRLHSEGSFYFDESELRAECDKVNLSVPIPAPVTPPRPNVAVRSFKRSSVDLADTSDELLSLLEHFDGRFLHDDQSWESVDERLGPFLAGVTERHQSFDLQLDTHASLAFSAGAILEAKRGLDINILQFGRGGMKPWSTTADSTTDVDLEVEDIEIGLGSDVALVLEITRPILDDVVQFVKSSGLPVGRLILLRPVVDSGQAAVRDASHALAIADQIARDVTKRSSEERQGILHLFAAAPNGLMFFIGQLSRGFGRVTLYEFDFERTRGGGYEASLTLPIGQ